MIRKLTIDRFEGDIAVMETEDDDYIQIPRCRLPEEAKEGSIITENCGCYELDKNATSIRRAEIAAKMRALFDK